MATDMGMKVHWAWVVLASSFITLFINYSIRIGAYSILLPGMIRDLHIDMTQAGMIRAAYFFAYILFSPLMGWLTDRIGARFIISFFCLFLGSGTFLMGKADSLITAILFHAVVGIGASAIWAPTVALIQKWFGTTRRGLALGVLSPSYALGYGLMGIVLPHIVNAYSWRMGWYLLGISGLILAVMNGFLLRSDPKDMELLPRGETSRSIEPPSSFHYRDIFRERYFWLIGFSYFFISAGVYIITDLIVTYGVNELKVPYPIASAFITILAFTGIAGGMIMMSLSDYIGRKKSLIIIHSLLALSILLIIFVGKQIVPLQIGVGIFGFFYSPIWPMYSACARDYFPKEVSGTVIGVLTIFYGFGAMLGPILAGRMVDLTGTFRWSFGLGALTCIIAALLVGRLGRPAALGREGD
ncbi:MAG: MFS transporter [Thermodesulfobacteriota bacterium]|nr:MFS transporter [Thermodesulfobacteriota bacterium]